MENDSLVSIITPMYKGEAFVGETIESVLRQTYADWEMIIVDDCSPDGGAGIRVVRQYADPRIRLIESKVNKGSSGARNIALREARGRYIAFLDSDDVWHPDFLARQLDFMKRNGAYLVFSSYRRIDEDDVERCGKKFYFNEDFGSMRDDYVYLLAMLKTFDYAYGNKEILVDYRMRRSSVTGDKRKVVYPQWRVLRKSEKLPWLLCAYYLACWAFISYFKYRK